jgi:terminase large subunit-like protein
MNIIAALDDPNLFGGLIRDPATFAAWRAFLCCLFGLPLPDDARPLVTQCTGLAEPPAGPFNEAWLVCGRRAGKSFVLALIAVYLACFRDHAHALTAGERGTLMVIAADRKQARTILRYVRGLLAIPLLAKMVERETADAFDLDNHVTIEIGTASIRSVRGYTIVAALCDEAAFWPSEDSSSPDYEILDSIRPGMATVPGAMLLCASSPYARRGALWDAHKRYFGKPDARVLVWQASTRTMNPTVPQSVIDNAMDRDPASAAAEYLAQFRSDLESFVSRDVIDAAVVAGRYELPPVSGITYSAFVDPSGGSADSMTLAIAHRGTDGTLVLDALRERKPPFSPEDVVLEFAALLKTYRVRTIAGDRFGGEWPRERFRVVGITYELSNRSKSDLYRDMLPLLNSGKVELLDHSRLLAQLCGLERRTARGGRDSIDHSPGQHDDIANAVAGAVLASSERRGEWFSKITPEVLAWASRPAHPYRDRSFPPYGW